MDKIAKALERLSEKEKKWVKDILLKLRARDNLGLNTQKLKGHADIFRARKGDIRIIYRRVGSDIFVLAIERRQEKTYRGF